MFGKLHAKHNLSKKFVFRRFIHYSIENFKASKNMWFLNFFEAPLHSKNQKNSKGVKKLEFRVFFIQLSFPSFMII